MAESEEELNEPLDEGERGVWKSYFETQYSKKLRWYPVPSFQGK